MTSSLLKAFDRYDILDRVCDLYFEQNKHESVTMADDDKMRWLVWFGKTCNDASACNGLPLSTPMDVLAFRERCVNKHAHRSNYYLNALGDAERVEMQHLILLGLSP